MFSNRYRYYYIVLLSVYSFVNVLAVELFEHYPIPLDGTQTILAFLAVIFCVWEGNRLLEAFFDKQSPNPKKFIRQYLLQNFIASLLVTLLSTLLIALFIIKSLRFSTDEAFLSTKLFLMFSFRINLFLNVLNIIFLYISKLEKAQSEAERFKKISVQAQLQAIKNQVNPHFLFNNLNVLSALIIKDPSTSIEFVRQFAKVYRYVLRSHEKEVVELRTELDFVDSYYFLLKKRFGEGLKIEIHVGEQLRNKCIVPMALQMLIENAIKHNVVSVNAPLHIDIYTEDEKTLTIQNNLQVRAVNEEDSTNIGLKNISQRYKLLGQGNIRIDNNQHSFIVRIPLIDLQKKANIEANFAFEMAN